MDPDDAYPKKGSGVRPLFRKGIVRLGAIA
jgi:hypothetical protein